MIDGGSKQPLLLQLLQERRKFAQVIVEMYAAKGVTDAVIQQCHAEESRRRATGARALPLQKLLVKKELITEREAAEAMKKVRAAGEGYIAPKDMEPFRKAQQESGASLERVLVKLGLATEPDITGAFAEYLHLPIARTISSNFGDIAVQRFKHLGVTPDLLAQCMAEQEKARAAGNPPVMLGQMLTDLKLLDAEQVKSILEAQQDLGKREGELVHNAEDAQLLPEKFCRDNLLCAARRENGNLVVAVVDPSNILLQEEIQHMAGLPVVLVVAPHSGVVAALNRVFGVRDVVREISVENYDSATAPQEDEAILDLQEPVPPGVDGRIIRLANTILEGAIVQRASDIHLEPFEKECRVRYRVDGELIEITPPPKAMFVPLVSRFKILAKMDIAEKRIAQDGAFGSKLGEARVDYRVNTVPTVYGEKMVMRLLRKEGKPLTLEQLGFLPKQAADFSKAIEQPHGLIFVTGPTGSGKSTTLYAALGKLNDPSTNITTVEDPVEYKMTGINQVQVKSQVGLTFATALRAFLRQDPDVMMVGEVRDRETAEICLRAALTGHLVVSTLHTNDSLAAVPRLQDMGIEPFLLAATLRMVEAQRLVRRLCPLCKQAVEIDKGTAARLGMTVGEKVYRAKGCEACRNNGYKGRVGLYEVIPITPELARAIQSRIPLPELRAMAQKQGMALLRDAGIMKAREGVTSLEEVLAITLAEDELMPAEQTFFLQYARVSSKRHKGIKSDDIFSLFQQLSTMIQAGMPLLDALQLAGEQSQSTRLAGVMDQIAQRVQAGSSLHAAAAEYPKIFESHWVQVIRTGEISGQIGPLLQRLTQNMKDNREARGKLVSAMIYPTIIFCVAVAAVVIMMWFVVPTFTQFFKETGSALPGITRAVIGISDFLQHYGFYLVGVLGAAGYGFWRWIKTPSGGRTFTSFLMALPIFGEVLINAAMEKFASNLALLLRAGMPLLESLHAMDNIFEKNIPYLESLADVQKRVSSGGTLAAGLAEGRLFTPIMCNLVRVGEESGQLPLVLEQVSSYYKQKVAALAARITAMIEPCIILGMGVTVAIILTAIYLPMFNMGGAVR